MIAPAAVALASASPFAPAEPPTSVRPRFTLDGDAALEEHLSVTCERIAAGLRGLLPAAQLEAVLLGGGYGRGEGGVLRLPEGDRPYNDLEFYVFLAGNRHVNEARFGRAVHVLGEILTPQAGIEVEFKLASRLELERQPVSMFSYDLVAGHRRLVGSETFLARCEHHRQAEDIPLAEATRLMMNRCTGLLLARAKLYRDTFTPGDADFVARNCAKAQLGAGDAILTAFGQYHWSARERHRRLERLAREERAAWLADLCHHHAAGVDFKLHPQRSVAERGKLHILHSEVSELCRTVWLWLENRRLGGHFRSVREYAESSVPKCPELRSARTLLVNAKALRRLSLRHPRERVLTALPLLLWQTDALAHPALRRRLQQELQTSATDFNSMLGAYRAIWERVN